MWNHEVFTIYVAMQNYLPNHSLALMHEGKQKLSKIKVIYLTIILFRAYSYILSQTIASYIGIPVATYCIFYAYLI